MVGELDNLKLSASDFQPIRFQGQFFDNETGLHYNRFRYYDNDVGMFIQRDPISLMGGFNVFAYAPNPVGWSDPLGLEEMMYGGQLLGYDLPTATTLEGQAIADADCYKKSGKTCTELSSQYSIQLFDYVYCSAGAGLIGGGAVYNLHNGNIYVSTPLPMPSATTLGKAAKITKNMKFKMSNPTLANIKKSFGASCMAGYILNKNSKNSPAENTDSFLSGLGISASGGAYGLRFGVSSPVNGQFFDKNTPRGIEVGVGTPGPDAGFGYNWQITRTQK